MISSYSHVVTSGGVTLCFTTRSAMNCKAVTARESLMKISPVLKSTSRPPAEYSHDARLV
jgi:hypothetical protein